MTTRTAADGPLRAGVPDAGTGSAVDPDLGLALSACRLDEREALLDGREGPAGTELDPLQEWAVQRAADRIAALRAQEAQLHGGEAGTERQARATLAAFARIDATAFTATDEHRLRTLHAAWLPTYTAALAADHTGDADAWWRAPEVFHDRLAIACAPFLRLMATELAAQDPALVHAAQAQLLDRFELAVVWAVEVTAKVHCARRGIDASTAGPDDYAAFLEETFAGEAAHRAFHHEFPVLARWLAHVTRQLVDATAELGDRFARDAPLVGRALFGQPIAGIRRLRFGQGDAHAGGRSVAALSVTLTDGSAGELMYKPRCVRAEAGLQRLMAELADRGLLPFAQRTVLAMDGYGWEERVPTGRNTVPDRAGAAAVYRELGGQLAIFYLLGGGDLHLENIVVADGHAHICDAETVLRVVRVGERRPIGTLLDSVFNTGMLEWPQAADDAQPDMRISGYHGGETYRLPVAVAQVGAERRTFGMGVRYRHDVTITPDGANRVLLEGAFVPPQEFAAEIIDGFERVYDWFCEHAGAAAAVLCAAFAGARVRLLNWSTAVYAQLLAAVRHPRALMDPLECDLVFGRLRALPSKHAQDRALVEHEIAALWRWDVPLFGAGAETTTLTCDHQLPVATTLALSPLDNAVERVLGLSPENRDQQTAYVAASLAADPDDAAFRTACLDHAEQIGARLCRMQREPDAPAPWQSYRLTGDGAIVIDIEAELYNGSAGVALFLAHLDRARPDATLRATAQRALEHALSARDRSRMGAFGGTAGAIYVLTHLAHLWQDTALLDTATGLADELAQQLPSDRHFDVLNGAAGAIVVLLGLHRATGSGLDLAHGCAAHLLQHAVSDGDVLSWPLFTPEEASANLTGLAHGAGGIGWALTELGAATGRSEYVDAGRAAFRYEARHFDGTARDWYDLRRNPAPADRDGKHFANAWCNGAAGVGLTRLAAWDATGRTDDGLLHEARIALTATVRGFVRLRNDTLCHGRSGNAELMLRFAEVCGEPAWRLEANVAVRSQWRSVDDAGSGFGDAGSSFFPGLMLGISGFGLHYLRLADPDRVPSVLLLDPPRSATGKAEACP